MKKKTLKDLNSIVIKLGSFLSFQLNHGVFPLDNYYGEIFFAGAVDNQNLKKDILNEYLKRDKTDIDFHWEFNNYILQQMKVNDTKFKTHYFNRPFYKKATNWILLRALIFIKNKKILLKIKGNLLTILTILVNQRRGIFYDNRLYRKKELSHQYHAFATVVLGEIFLETKKDFYKKRFLTAVEELKKMCIKIEKFNNGGRGSKQIFGYSSAIYALSLYNKILGISSGKEIDILVNELLKFQRKDGSIPLCLTNEEFNFKPKDYLKNKKIKGWESYNRYYDYLGFSYYFLNKSKQLL